MIFKNKQSSDTRGSWDGVGGVGGGLLKLLFARTESMAEAFIVFLAR